MTKVEMVVFKIDQDLLAQQCAWLIAHARNGSEEADGLVLMIGDIFNAAWDDGILAENNDVEDES